MDASSSSSGYTDYTRRDFLQLLSSGTAALSILATTGGCSAIINAIQNRPTRKMLGNLSSNHPDIQTFKAAVRQLRGRSSSPSYRGQANIHRDHCRHGNWLFLPWHRAYLHYFERICRDITGNDDFALPYWNWSVNPSIPSQFWGSNNPLSHSRSATQNSTADASAVGPSRLNTILGNNFTTFAGGSGTFGELESGPHNYIHCFVGGDMCQVPLAARDPLFWTHHGMVDCCWVEWNVNRQNNNTNASQWTNHTFQNFVDEQGNSVSIDVQETLLLPLLAYQYQPSQKGAAEVQMATLDSEKVKERVRRGADVELEVRDRFSVQRGIDVSIDEPRTIELNVDPQVLRAIIGERQDNRVFLTVQGVQPPRRSDFYVRTFINRPTATRESTFDDPAYAGSFAFFTGGEVQDTNTGRGDYLLDLTQEIRRLLQRGDLEDETMSIRLIAVPFETHDEITSRSFSLEGIDLALASPPETRDPDER